MKRDKLEIILGMMGGTPDAIAERLTSMELTAIPEECSRCAVAVFLSQVDGPTSKVLFNVVPYASGSSSGIVEVNTDFDKWYTVELPQAVNDFAVLFDRDAYPDLVDEDWREDMEEDAAEWT